MSIWLMTASMSWRMRSGALMTSEFVPGSAQIVTGPVIAGAPPSAGAGAAPPLLPNCACSLVASSSASA